MKNDSNHQAISFASESDLITGVLWLPDTGQPAPLVIVCHGAGGWKEDLDELCEFLSNQGYAALALDMHGHGESEGERWCLDMTLWAKDISTAIDYAYTRPEIDAVRVAVWGFSSGGTAMFEAAVRDSRIKVLIGLDATISSRGLPWGAKLVLGLLHGFGLIHQRVTGRDLRLDISEAIKAGSVISDPGLNHDYLNDPQTLAPYRDYPFPGGSQGWFIDTYQRLSKINMPTLVIWGEKDELDPVASAHETIRLLQCIKELEIIPGNGHIGYRDLNKAKVFERTVAWLKAHL